MTHDRLRPPPIDPLPDIAWARVERAVLAELDAPATRPVRAPARRWWPIAAAVAAAAAVVIVVVVASRGGGGGTSPVAPRTASQPSRVVTGDVPSEVSYGDAHVRVAPASALVLDGDAERGVLAVLERGSATFVVTPRHGRPAFVVQAGAVGVRVVGTELVVTRIGDEDASVEVREGAVAVTYHGRVATVLAGQRWDSTAVVETASTTTLNPDVNPDAGVTAAREHKRGSASPRAGSAVKAAPSAQEQFEAAAKLEATDPKAAMAGYREVARGKGAWAGNALYALGRLAHDRGEQAVARDALASYLRRFPRGANAADARALLATLQGAPK
jgi:hypothetical protein